MKTKLIQLFEKVQKIPYQVCKFEESEVHENIKQGDCRHKSLLLYNLLKKEGFEVKKVIVLFDWNDLPVPKELLKPLNSHTFWAHRSLAVKINNKWLKVDPTWNPELKKKGFPITENWDGNSDTKQVTNGKLEFYYFDSYKSDPRVVYVKEESKNFAEVFNKFLSN